mmetsp:Transcript_89545/g.278659  ORF Transcript_89545/g.278659 Transcript_89545/m.278659 type:complete len:313 (-) Transcript_89545:406-1344(-)
MRNMRASCTVDQNQPSATDPFKASRLALDAKKCNQVRLPLHPVGLRRPRELHVLALHLAVRGEELFLQLRLAPAQDLVDGRRLCGQQARDALGEAEPCGDILAEIAEAEVGHEASVGLDHGMAQALVGRVGVHGRLQCGGVGDARAVGGHVPLVDRLHLRSVERLVQALQGLANGLDVVRDALQGLRGERVNAVIEERLLCNGPVVPVLPLAVSDARMDDLSRIAEADAHHVGAIHNHRLHPQQALQLENHIHLRLSLGRQDRGADGLLRAQNRSCLAPSVDAASPRQRLERHEAKGLCLGAHGLLEQKVAA